MQPKSVIRIKHLCASDIAKIDMLVHIVMAGLIMGEAQFVHIHHMREAFHNKVCSHYLDENNSSPPPEWHIHDHDQKFMNIDRVWDV